MGFSVYLEVSPPNFLPERYARNYDFQLVSGLICRNGTILPTGMQRDAFMMEPTRPALRALAAQASMGGCSTVMMWDVVDDTVAVELPVIKRCYDWCRFNSAISWIGPLRALVDAEVAVNKTIPGEPMGAM
ncbi:MAG: hypothetical protein M1823_008699, partial [Watsoniomyces obsoletus]